MTGDEREQRLVDQLQVLAPRLERIVVTTKQQAIDADAALAAVTRAIAILREPRALLLLVLLWAPGCCRPPDPLPPAALTLLAQPRTQTVGELVDFTARATVAPLAYVWSFSDDDGTTVQVSAGGDVSHRFKTAGIREVEAVAVHADGTRASARVLIAIVNREDGNQ
jgi:PKD repeat protein